MRSALRLLLFCVAVFIVCAAVMYTVWFWGIPFIPSKGSDGSDQRLTITAMVLGLLLAPASLIAFRDHLVPRSPQPANPLPGAAPAANPIVGNHPHSPPVVGRIPRLTDRYLANVLDGFVPIFLALPVVVAFLIATWVASARKGIPFDEYTPSSQAAVACLVPLLSVLLVAFTLEFITGTSIGKYAMGMRVKRVDGQKVRLRDACTRGVCKYVLFLVGAVTVFGVWLLLLLWRIDVKRRFLWDRVAGTYVVSTR
ncbi:RDD family protein [Streptomyces lushanensis]|uniref:RDD family protein n=1 Tax=Streptomyces lushanensis TaxID=1434255 RepID=UPI00099F51BB|nr:RDD family protein [Streptomyces lushanensis]